MPWTHDEDLRLGDLFAEDRYTLWQIGVHMQKTAGQVKQRWRRICAMYGETPDSTLTPPVNDEQRHCLLAAELSPPQAGALLSGVASGSGGLQIHAALAVKGLVYSTLPFQRTPLGDSVRAMIQGSPAPDR